MYICICSLAPAIGECCPRLQNLALSAVAHYEDIMYPRENYFNSLVNVEVSYQYSTVHINYVVFYYKKSLGYLKKKGSVTVFNKHSEFGPHVKNNSIGLKTACKFHSPIWLEMAD